MSQPSTSGLPYESRNFTFDFKLNNVFTNPTDVNFHVGRIDENGHKTTVLTGVKSDLHFVSTGRYSYQFIPERSGWHFFRIWNTNDTYTKDVEYKFYVPEPSVPETAEAA